MSTGGRTSSQQPGEGPDAERAREVFGARAAYYTTSKCHTDPEVLAEVVEVAHPRPEWRALDVGTGTGHTAFALAPHVSQVIGVDITPEMLAEARRLRETHGLNNVRFELADAHALPYDDASFDLVTCRRAAHHFSDITRAVVELARVIKPGGRLVIDDRSVPDDSAVAAIMNRLDWYHDESHIREYSPAEWQDLLTAAGLQPDSVQPYIKYRPLTSLTDNVSRQNVEAIHTLLAGLTASQQRLFNLDRRDGMVYFIHWYVIVGAFKPATNRS